MSARGVNTKSLNDFLPLDVPEEYASKSLVDRLKGYSISDLGFEIAFTCYMNCLA